MEFLSTTKSLQWLDNQYSFETAVLNRVGDRRIHAAPVCFFSEDPNRSGLCLGKDGQSAAHLDRTVPVDGGIIRPVSVDPGWESLPRQAPSIDISMS